VSAAIVQLCVDPRLSHEVVRAQVRQRVARHGETAERIYVVNGVGGNPGASFTHTVEMLGREGEVIVFCGILHHDDCLAARHGLRMELADAAKWMTTELARQKIACPVFVGDLTTATNLVRWADEPEIRYRPFTFGPGWG
jgi:hypothetical protein